MPTPQFRLVPYRRLPFVDWTLLALALVLALLGIVTLWGATAGEEGVGALQGFALQQAVWLGISLVPMTLLVIYDYRSLRPFLWYFYAVLLLLLAALPFLGGAASHGERLWYDLKLFHFQPSEPGKLVVVLVLASYLAKRGREFRGLRHAFVPLFIVGLPVLLIVRHDFGTAMVFVPITGAMFWAAGLHKRVFMLFAVAGVALAVAGYPHLSPYQQGRIKTFLHPNADPRGQGYNSLQAKTALGSGQIFGKGWGKGTQTTFHYLPEYHTDFIFPTVGEQFGLVGCTIVLGLMGFLIMRMVHLAQVTQDLFGVLIITGLATMLASHMVLNVGMTVGLMPVTGLPLPFFSYGGTFVLTCMTSVGLTVGIGARRGL